jgi:hypothetical protein
MTYALIRAFAADAAAVFVTVAAASLASAVVVDVVDVVVVLGQAEPSWLSAGLAGGPQNPPFVATAVALVCRLTSKEEA